MSNIARMSCIMTYSLASRHVLRVFQPHWLAHWQRLTYLPNTATANQRRINHGLLYSRKPDKAFGKEPDLCACGGGRGSSMKFSLRKTSKAYKASQVADAVQRQSKYTLAPWNDRSRSGIGHR